MKERTLRRGRKAECTHSSIVIDLIPAIGQGIQTFLSAIDQEDEQTLRSHRKILDTVRRHRSYDAQRAMQFRYNRNRFRGKREGMTAAPVILQQNKN